MITDFEKEMLERALNFLEITQTEPITLGKIQEIINHASEEFDSFRDVKIKYLVQNPDNDTKLIFGITDIEIIKEINMISFKSFKNSLFPKKINEKTFEASIDEEKIYSLNDLQNIIESIKIDDSKWSSILINIENIYIPNTYNFFNNSVFFTLGEN